MTGDNPTLRKVAWVVLALAVVAYLCALVATTWWFIDSLGGTDAGPAFFALMVWCPVAYGILLSIAWAYRFLFRSVEVTEQ